MTTTQTLALADGVRVVVRDEPHLITPYVLREQGDWFEDEIRFVRRVLNRGDQAVDIGANHGVYALSMARAVGPSGTVWAFEPASAVADLLDCSVAVNGFAQLHVQRQALSSREGEATLFVSPHSELSTLNEASATAVALGGAAETVALTTLDACMDRLDWRRMDFVKMDAEGEEAQIIEGAERFLRKLSPLVMYELRAGEDLQMHLVEALARRGYLSYRLIPGLGLLAPFQADEALDEFQLNLFACKPDRAARLAEAGLLVTAAALAGARPLPQPDWLQRLQSLPYGRRLAGTWNASAAQGLSPDVALALALHARAHEPAGAAPNRLAALRRSLALLQVAAAQPGPHTHTHTHTQANPNPHPHLRLASLARVAAEAGERAQACKALHALCAGLVTPGLAGPSEPFLSPSPRFDHLPPQDAIGNWLLAATLEERERLSAHSSFFSGQATWESLKAILSLGFASDEMRRRADLVQQRFGLAMTAAV